MTFDLSNDSKIVFDGTKCYSHLAVGGPVSVYQAQSDTSNASKCQLKKGDLALAWFHDTKQDNNNKDTNEIQVTVYKPTENTNYQTVPMEGNYTHLTYLAGKMASYGNIFTKGQGFRQKTRLSYAGSMQVQLATLEGTFRPDDIQPGSMGLCFLDDNPSVETTMHIWGHIPSVEDIEWSMDVIPDSKRKADKKIRCPQNGNFYDSDIQSNQLKGYSFS